jgi:tripartite-type tricarboxylate transporter receptor subunit TctC
LNTALPQAKAGKIRILGVASGKRSALLPDAPAIAETVPGYDITVTLGLFAPAATPAGVIRRLNADFTAAAMADVTRERLASSGIESMRTAETPSRYSAIMRKEFQDYGRIVQAAQLKKFD